MRRDVFIFTRPDKTKVTFRHWFRQAGNVHLFRAEAERAEDAAFAQRFAEFFGMQIGELDEFAEVDRSILVCTNDTFCHILKYRMDEFLQRENVTLKCRY